MSFWEFRIKQYKYNLKEQNIQSRSRNNYEVEEIISDYGKDGYELVNVITEPLFNNDNKPTGNYIRTFFFKRNRNL